MKHILLKSVARRFQVVRWLLMAMVASLAAGGCSGPGRDAAPAPARCERACLEGYIDRYLAALAAHDPSRLPLSPGVRFVENNVVLRVGEGTWRTVTGLGTYRHYFADPETGQAAVMTVVEENGAKIIYDLRLKVDQQKITEVETMAVRDPAGAKLYEDLGKPLPIFLAAVPPAERAPRAALMEVANKYFSGMQNNDPKGDYSFFADDCNRLEHARQTTNMPSEKYGHSNDEEFVTLSCRRQFQTGFLGFVTRIRDRRYAVIDEERQSIFAFAFLDHNGTVRTINMSNARVFTVPPYFSVPRSLQVGEAWRIEKGKLRQIEMTLSEFPYGMRPAFDTGDKWLEGAGREAAPGETAPASAAAPAKACDRNCLEGFTDTFLRALLAHDSRLLPLAPSVRFTQNGQRLNIRDRGDGLWGTVTALGGYKLYLSNPLQGEAGYYGSIVENDTPGILAVRLKIQGGLLTEVETVVVRQEVAGERGGTLTLFAPRLPHPFDPAKYVRPDAVLAAKLTPPQRTAADRMVAVAHTNGAGFRERRALVTDEEAGLVLDVSLFDVPNTTKSVDVPTLTSISLPAASTGPFSLLMATVSKIRAGKVLKVDTAFRPVPYGMTSGWN